MADAAHSREQQLRTYLCSFHLLQPNGSSGSYSFNIRFVRLTHCQSFGLYGVFRKLPIGRLPKVTFLIIFSRNFIHKIFNLRGNQFLRLNVSRQ